MASSAGYDGMGKFRLDSAPKRRANNSAATGRRPHTKSRAGCRRCKKDRLKCDELYPRCGRCAERKKPCLYNDSSWLSVENPARSEHQLRAVEDSWKQQSVSFQWDLTLARSLADRIAGDSAFGTAITSANHLMQNFSKCILETVATPLGQALFTTYVLPNCAATPTLLHSLLALSARHLQYHQPRCQSHHIAYRFHASQATGLLNRDLERASLGPQNIAILYAVCLIINIVSFASDESCSSISWISKHSTKANESFSWFSVQGGLGHFASILKNHIDRTFWRLKVELNESPLHTMADRISKGIFFEELDNIPPFLLDLCEITQETTADHNPYYTPIYILSQVLRLKLKTVVEFDFCLTFGPLVSPSFRALVLGKDERALLLFLLWLRLLSHGDFWWIKSRIKSESTAISAFLSGSRDERIRDGVWKFCSPVQENFESTSQKRRYQVNEK